MSALTCIRCVVSGKVQGVWFRASTKEEAQKLGVTGWVRNLPDGCVEVLACGPEDKLTALHAWLHQGPRSANVTDVSYEILPWQDHDAFNIV